MSTDNLPAPFENFDWNANPVAKRASQGMAELLATYDTERGEV